MYVYVCIYVCEYTYVCIHAYTCVCACARFSSYWHGRKVDLGWSNPTSNDWLCACKQFVDYKKQHLAALGDIALTSLFWTTSQQRTTCPATKDNVPCNKGQRALQQRTTCPATKDNVLDTRTTITHKQGRSKRVDRVDNI